MYLPFLTINMLSLFISYSEEKSIFLQIILGTGDGVLWYVPFIMAFYCIYYLICVFLGQYKYQLLILVAIVTYVLLNGVGLESQWYTSIGPLVLGIVIGQVNLKRFKHICVFGVCCIVGVILSRYFDNVQLLKDLFTTIAGMGFCGTIFGIFALLPDIDQRCNIKVVSFVSKLTFWVYLIHMKIGYILRDYNMLDYVKFILCTIVGALVVEMVYTFLMSLIINNCNQR